MVASVCIKLTACNIDQTIYVYGGFNGQPTANTWLSYVGLVVNITDVNTYITQNGDTVTFLDTSYTVEAVETGPCLPADTDCITCYSNQIIEFEDGTAFDADAFIEQVTSTESADCPITPAFVLVNCEASVTFDTPDEIDPSPTGALVTNTNLAFYVGSVIRIDEYPDYCYQVLGPYTTDTGCPCPEFTVTGGYMDCECCIPDLPPKFVRTVQDPVKQFYYVPNTECDIRINKKFAENYYNLYLESAYGMKNCCSLIDLEKLWIEMTLNNYSKINDPDACTVPEVVVPIECEGPAPQTCNEPTEVSAVGNFN